MPHGSRVDGRPAKSRNALTPRYLQQEIKDQILAVGRSTSLHRELHARLAKLGDAPEKTARAPAQLGRSALNLITNNIEELFTRALFDTNAPKFLRALFKHGDADIRDRAAHLYTTLHSDWMERQAKRRRLK